MREKTMRLSDEEWKMINEARNKLAHQGYSILPKQVQENYPIDDYTKGAIVGLGMAALLYLLAKQR